MGFHRFLISLAFVSIWLVSIGTAKVASQPEGEADTIVSPYVLISDQADLLPDPQDRQGYGESFRKDVELLNLPFNVMIVTGKAPSWDEKKWAKQKSGPDERWNNDKTGVLVIGVFPESNRYIIWPSRDLARSLPLEECRRIAEKEFTFSFEKGEYSVGILNALEELNAIHIPVADIRRTKLGQTLITVGILILIITMLRYWRIARSKRPEYKPKEIKADEIVEPEDIPPDEQVEGKEEPVSPDPA